jgi:hypothetical protein
MCWHAPGKASNLFATLPRHATACAGTPNRPPVVLANSSYTVQQGSDTMSVPAPGPLANVADPDGDELYMEVSSPPSNGKIMPYPWGQFFYLPNPGFVGLDSFTFTARDGHGGSALGTVTINVTKGERRCWHAWLTNLACTCCVRVAGPMTGSMFPCPCLGVPAPHKRWSLPGIQRSARLLPAAPLQPPPQPARPPTAPRASMTPPPCALSATRATR